jgi:hypothetical protein
MCCILTNEQAIFKAAGRLNVPQNSEVGDFKTISVENGQA